MEASQGDTRAWLAQRLKMRNVPDPLWRKLELDGYVADERDGYINRQDLLHLAQELLKFSKEMGVSLDRKRARGEDSYISTSYVPPSRLGDPVHERARAAAPYLLKRLEASSAVENFRRRLNAPLSREEAQELIHAPESASGLGCLKHARLFWDGLETFGVDVEEGSLLWELYDTADRLPPGPWRPEHVMWWLLTGEVPQVQPLQADIRFGAWPTVTLTVPAWTTGETVGGFHKETKEHAWASVAALADFEKEAKSRTGSGEGFAPTPSLRRLAVFTFVAERGEFRGGDFVRNQSWRSLMELWNRLLPENHDWCYTDVRNFSRDFKETREALVGGADI